MTYQDDFTLPTELLEQVAEQGLDFLPELIRILINTAMQVERQKHLGVRTVHQAPGACQRLQAQNDQHPDRADHFRYSPGAGRRLLPTGLGERDAQ